MPATLDEVKKIIEDGFPGANVQDITEENHRVLGSIVWSGFKGKESNERYRLITERVRDKLGLRGLNVGVLFALAPGEKL